MKITLDLSKLLAEGKITQQEHDHLLALSGQSTGSVAFNILIGIGVMAVAGGGLALAPTPQSAIVIGALLGAAGMGLNATVKQQWGLLGAILILIAALYLGGGIVMLGEGSVGSFVTITVLFAAGAVAARSALLAALAVLALSSCLGARTEYFHAEYCLGIKEPTMTIVCFTIIAIAAYLLSLRLKPDFARLALVTSRTAVLLVNFAFWIGSLWGDRLNNGRTDIPDWAFAIAWAVALLAAGAWAWRANRPWLVSAVAVFGAFHLYTQWFERLGASPGSVVIGGIVAIALAMGIWKYNQHAAAAMRVPLES